MTMNFNFFGFTIETLLIAMAVVLSVSVFVSILYYVGLWKTLQKMGRHDFAALVPGYHLWEFSRGAGFGPGLSFVLVALFAATLILGCVVQFLTPHAFTLSLFWNAVPLMLPGDGTVDIQAVGAFLGDWGLGLYGRHETLILVLAVVAALFLLLWIYACYGVARSFGHGFFFALGLLILPFLFLTILGCGRSQRYGGPYLDRQGRSGVQANWPQLVSARKATFGSNAPLAMALMGMVLGAVFLTIPGIVLCIVALVKNGADKGKPLAGAKCTATTVVALLGILISLAVLAAFFFLGSFANSFYGYSSL